MIFMLNVRRPLAASHGGYVEAVSLGALNDEVLNNTKRMVLGASRMDGLKIMKEFVAVLPEGMV